MSLGCQLARPYATRQAVAALLPEAQNPVLLAAHLLDLLRQCIKFAAITLMVFVALALLRLADAEFELVVMLALLGRQMPIAVTECILAMLLLPPAIDADDGVGPGRRRSREVRCRDRGERSERDHG